MDFHRKPRVKLTEGWALSKDLIKNPYASPRWMEQDNSLCAEFRRMVFENGVPVRPSKAHSPDYLALTETELRDMTPESRATIMGVRGELRQAAFEKFPPLIKPVPAPSHVIEPVEPPQLFVVYQQPRQMAAAISEDRHFQMRG